MKIKSKILIIILIVVSIFISACSNENEFRGRRFNPEERRGFMGNLSDEERQRMMEERSFRGNMSEEERQQMFEERQKMAMEACLDKREGDSCMQETPMGSREGKCSLIDEQLICMGGGPPR